MAKPDAPADETPTAPSAPELPLPRCRPSRLHRRCPPNRPCPHLRLPHHAACGQPPFAGSAIEARGADVGAAVSTPAAVSAVATGTAAATHPTRSGVTALTTRTANSSRVTGRPCRRDAHSAVGASTSGATRATVP